MRFIFQYPDYHGTDGDMLDAGKDYAEPVQFPTRIGAETVGEANAEVHLRADVLVPGVDGERARSAWIGVGRVVHDRLGLDEHAAQFPLGVCGDGELPTVMSTSSPVASAMSSATLRMCSRVNASKCSTKMKPVVLRS
jgi:hypothetical protein